MEEVVGGTCATLRVGYCVHVVDWIVHTRWNGVNVGIHVSMQLCVCVCVCVCGSREAIANSS